MTLFRPKTEQRSISFQQVYGTGADTLGDGVERALRLIPVYASTRLLADDVSSLPLNSVAALVTPPPRVNASCRLVASGLTSRRPSLAVWAFRFCAMPA